MSATRSSPAKVARDGARPPAVPAVRAATLPFPELVDLVVERTGVPVDVHAVAAMLESEGIRDVDARDLFGKADVFDLAGDVYRAAPQKAVEPEVASEPPPGAWTGLRRFLRLYSRGVLFALPVVLQLATVIVVQVREEFTDAKATSVMLGSILSFCATGGFSQAIGRLGSTYTSRSAFHLTRDVVLRVIALGTGGALATAGIWAAVAFTLHPFPDEVALNGLWYELLLSWLWLALGVLYMLERRVLVVAMVVLWLGVFALLVEVGQSVMVSQLAGYGTAATVASVVSWVELRRLAARTPSSARTERLPRWPVLFVGTAPYFAYGLLYFGLLFGDRIVGWSVHPPAGFLFSFRRPYEFGLDWALLSLVLTVAALEYTIHELGELIEPTQRRCAGSRLREHNRTFQTFYARQLALFVAVAAASGVLTWAVIAQAGLVDGISALHALVEVRETVQVFAVAVVAYALLAFGLMNAIFLFFLSRPGAPILGLALGAVATVVVGGVASRTQGAWTSSWGLLAGTTAFGLVTAVAAIRVVRRMDYYCYAAY